jgi:hypothetical protein
MANGPADPRRDTAAGDLMCAELTPAFRTLLGAIKSEMILTRRIDHAVERVTRWSWRRAPSGAEYDEPFWAEREGLHAGPELPGAPPAGVAADLIGRDAAGAVTYAELHDRRGHSHGRLARSLEDDLVTSTVIGDTRLELALTQLVDDQPESVHRVRVPAAGRFDLCAETYRRSGQERITKIARTQATYDGVHYRVLSEREFLVEYDDNGLARIWEPALKLVLFER